MTADELRRAFLDFFVGRGHTEVPSASLIPHDKTVLFTVAGMIPFKPYFTGEEPAPYPPATSSRSVSGRRQVKRSRLRRPHEPPLHVLRDARQLLFGDYFKAEAIGSPGSSTPRCSVSTPTGCG